MGKSNIAFDNLREKMAYGRLTISDLASAAGVSRDTMGKKLSRKSPINLDEAFSIQRTFFPEYELEYLFASTEVEAG